MGIINDPIIEKKKKTNSTADDETSSVNSKSKKE